ncbi:MAG: hypothetical protein K6G33_02435 [Ruminococcus sp.]|uniref:hypothetical protein n=1 Tax=Ruminococcus sp. TaxID=41978 RepID=UPI0025DC84E8|nr:hypothetical protein [Ruminococcus sp.]MCR5599586.1 hypothetical protein [Ruminococcus sp.]
MKLRSILLLFSVVICVFLVGCGDMDYPTYTYEISNGLGENYLVNYCEQVSYPEHTTRVKVFKETNKVSDYDGGAYTGCNSYTPSQVMYICSKDKVDYYYLRTQCGEYVAADGVSSIRMNYNMMQLGQSNAEMDDLDKRNCSKLASNLREAISAEAVMWRFNACGYSSDNFMQLYYFQR